jgi:chaperonin GroEL
MSKQKIELGANSRKKLLQGVNKIAEVVTSTLGPHGRNIIYSDGNSVNSTKDGVSVAKRINELEDPIENLGAQLIKQASIKTADAAGDGTTTSTLLASKMINDGFKHLNNGENAVQIKRDIDIAVKQVVEYIHKDIKSTISSEDQLEQIATISANNDVETGKLIATAMSKVGIEGVVHIEESKTGETYLETVEGMQFDRGYKSHYFVTDNNTMSCLLDNPYILIADSRFNTVKELLPILEGVSNTGRSLLIIAEDIDNEALATLIVNKMRGTIKVCAVKAPDFGDRRKLILEDIAVLTGGQVFSKEKGMKLDKFDWAWFGEARMVTVKKEQTTIVDGKGNETSISSRIEELKLQIEKSTTAFETEKLQERLAKFTGGVAIIHVGGNTETEMKEKKDRVDDALHATKAAIDEGIVPGGGIALIKARKSITGKSIGSQIVYEACSSPFRKILSNAGYSDENIYKIMTSLPDKSVWGGYDLKNDKYVNMKDKGIIDPAKVVRCALENAASVAGIVLLTEGAIIDVPEEKNTAVDPQQFY